MYLFQYLLKESNFKAFQSIRGRSRHKKRNEHFEHDHFSKNIFLMNLNFIL